MTVKTTFKLLALIGCGLFIACKAKKRTPSATLLQGHIYYLSGNQMPGPGRTTGKSRGVKREILIYRPTTSKGTSGQMPLFSQINTKLVARTQSNASGYYQVKLPAGKYSVFIKEENGFFAAEADGEEHLNPVVIPAGHPLTKDFTITLHAAF
ncbi:carboxypeptidase regulatory-like domain-containing protein [Mucilaginibacter sp. Bleaf8]|uniref:carboxypeptidase-like regulatory domain-containing protein n=1 Tax=Mucilaginibacter sp. Bleaf8 TaxID=2834430 RepID=UPI001BCE44AE|nr:carboxypeptidase-like regulatory domain-containing protein [Mucilaginibacter sp. Bleaf8]MBS7564303.1 carboxypeptidase regulatory-like domain-containing protein [Mucilaginibacter sp. Bleaf8]